MVSYRLSIWTFKVYVDGDATLFVISHLSILIALLQNKDHTIVLVQPEADKYSRIYYDFETLHDAVGGEVSAFPFLC